jgi:xanthine dehydrogenase YagS FAD-binding subunit
MQTFEWVDATSVEEAVSALAATTGAEPVVAKAGGIDLIDLLKEGIVRPARVVNLTTIEGLDQITIDKAGTLTLGALVTLARIDAAPEVRHGFPALADAARHAATPQVRNAATIGGNLLQRPRCWYFRSAHFHRNGADAMAAARDGENQYHAIFDNTRTAMVHASTPATALVAYGAEVVLTGEHGRSRSVPLTDFLLAPDASRDRDTAIRTNEVLTSVRVPAPHPRIRAAYHKQTERESYDWPICDVAVVLAMDADTVRDAAVVMGWVAPTPRRATECERLLRGARVTEELARQVAAAAVAGATPLSKNAYKVPVLEAVVRRTILAATAAPAGDA